MLEDCADEPRISAQAGCRAGERQRHGPGSRSKPGRREEAGKGFGERVEGCEHLKTEEQDLGRATGPPGPHVVNGAGGLRRTAG